MTRDRYTLRQLHLIGSISSGTLRTEDLLDAFTSELKHVIGNSRGWSAHRKLVRDAEKLINADSLYRQVQAEDMVIELMDALSEHALPCFYFGAHPNDGADFGWWLGEGVVEEFDGLKVNDLSKVPREYCGAVLLVNDQGDTSLLVSNGRGKLREIWSIV